MRLHGLRHIGEEAAVPKGIFERKPRPFTPAALRFHKYVSPEPNTGCWLWTGALNMTGYGQMTEFGRRKLATHISMEIDGRPRPSKQFYALHKCDMPLCVNPDHLWWGTQSENMRDMHRKKRRTPPAFDYCRKGHQIIDENLKINANGRRMCAICEKERTRIGNMKQRKKLKSNPAYY